MSDSSIPYLSVRPPTPARRRYFTLAADLLVAFIVIGVIGVSVILSAVSGGLIGKAIATWFPHYYPSVYPVAAASPGFDAAEVGIATGIGQGAGAGVFIGLGVVIAMAIKNRGHVIPSNDAGCEPRLRPQSILNPQ